MKKLYNSTLITITFLFTLFVSESQAQNFSELDKVPHDIAYYRMSRVTPPLVKVIYGRPQKFGEEVFGNIVPFDKIWRTGANEATEIKFYKDVLFGDTLVAAGTYVLYTIPGKDKWEVILNSKLDVIGAFQYNPTFDVAKIKVSACNAEMLESFSIAFKNLGDNLQMVLGWDSTRVKIPLHFEEESVFVER